MHPYGRASYTGRRQSEVDDYSEDGDGRDSSGISEVKGERKEDEGKGGGAGEGKEKKGVINRVNRACNNCRRMKMRCVGAEEPPCKRCRNGGLECVMEKPGRAPGNEPIVGEDRIRSLEHQVSSIQNTLSDLVTTLKAGMSSNASNGSGSTPAALTTTPEYASTMSNNFPSQGGIPGSMQDSGRSTSGFDMRQGSFSQNINNPFYQSPNTAGSSYLSQRDAGSSAAYNPYTASGSVSFTYPGRQDMPPPQLPESNPSFRQFPSSGSNDQTPESAIRRAPPPGPSHSFSWPASANTQQPHAHTLHMSLPPSRAGSEAPEDILAPDEIINPLGVMSKMAGLVEAAVERAREEGMVKANPLTGGGPGSAGSAGKRPAGEAGIANGSGGPGDDGRGAGSMSKKARFAPTGPIVIEAQGLPASTTSSAAAKAKAKVKRPHSHAYPDAVAEGYLTEDEGRELMQIFYSGSSNFIPCYDRNVDTWEALRVRSPFSITAICMVGARVRDGGGPISEVQRQCREHAQRIAVNTMFQPVARIEAVQAMILISAFSENGWLPGGHAVRMAVDMGVNKSFVRLLKDGMGRGKTPEELEEERPLVVHSRVWFCLYLMEHQMAYGMGRPAILREDESIHQCRRLLEHPLSITSDARLVSTVELMALRAPLHIELTASPDLPIDQNTLIRLKQANADFDSWERYWDRVLSERFGKGRGDFFRESLAVQRQYAELFVNSQLLRGIRESTDVATMPEEKRNLAIRAMRNAQHCIDICLRGENYRNGLRYAVHYTHVCAAFAASFLIRIARLFPHELNLRKTAKDVEELAGVLSEIPAGRYARSLRLILRRARRAKVIPAASVLSSPNKLAVPLPMTNMPASGSQGLPNEPVSAFSPSQLVNPSYLPTPTTSGLSPNSLLMNASNIINDSPQSATELFEFDFLFAQETLEKAGLKLGEGDELPLFLDGHSLGASGPEITPFVGMENFFLPADVDNRLGGPSMDGLGNLVHDDIGGSGNADGSTNGNAVGDNMGVIAYDHAGQSLGGDIWW